VQRAVVLGIADALQVVQAHELDVTLPPAIGDRRSDRRELGQLLQGIGQHEERQRVLRRLLGQGDDVEPVSGPGAGQLRSGPSVGPNAVILRSAATRSTAAASGCSKPMKEPTGRNELGESTCTTP
jgi:hypothetical protein